MFPTDSNNREKLKIEVLSNTHARVQGNEFVHPNVNSFLERCISKIRTILSCDEIKSFFGERSQSEIYNIIANSLKFHLKKRMHIFFTVLPMHAKNKP